MKLTEMIEQGFQPCAWAMQSFRGERYVTVKLSKTTTNGKRFYVVHSPQVETILADVELTILADVEFTEPVLLKEVAK